MSDPEVFGPFACAIEDGVAVLDWQEEGRSMNVLGRASIESLAAAMERSVADPAVRGIVITSSRPDLGGGADLRMLFSLQDGPEGAAQALQFAQATHAVFRRIETCGKPVAAATPGSAAGGVFELMLACHRRFAADNASARIGLPETRVGLFPGAGGTTRLIRMLGLEKAGPLLLDGRMLAPAAAQAAGLIDEVVSADALMASAAAWVREAGAGAAVKPWDRSGYRLPGGGPYTPKGAPVFIGAATLANARTRGNYPAVRALLSAAYNGALVDFDTALQIEARQVAQLLRDPRARNMIRTNFLSPRVLERGLHRPPGAAPVRTSALGVVGAGMMGAGIAYAGASRGMRVVLLERDAGSLERGMESVRSRADAAVRRGRLHAAQASELIGRITPALSYDALAGSELVIEAVFEDPQVKADVLTQIEAAADAAATIASNTSTLPISELAAALAHPDRFVGIHFFSPVEHMRLVEIIRGKKTGDAAIGHALDLAAALRKTPIVVQDARFFFANRCIIPYSLEAVRMVAEGVNPARIENAALAAGMPVGCLQLVDETSLALSLQILQATRAALGDGYRPTPADEVLEWMVKHAGRSGRKAGAGFYSYAGGRRTGLWPGLAARWPAAAVQPPVTALQNRLLAIQALEAVRALEEGVLADVREGDVGAVLGWGFAPWSGGPFSWLDLLGAHAAVALCEQLAAAHGARFAPPRLLRRLAREQGSFYGTLAERAA